MWNVYGLDDNDDDVRMSPDGTPRYSLTPQANKYQMSGQRKTDWNEEQELILYKVYGYTTFRTTDSTFRPENEISAWGKGYKSIIQKILMCIELSMNWSAVEYSYINILKLVNTYIFGYTSWENMGIGMGMTCSRNRTSKECRKMDFWSGSS